MPREKLGKDDAISDEQFEELKRRALEIWETDPTLKQKLVSQHLIDRNVISRLRKGVSFQQAARRRLHLALDGLSGLDLYDAISSKMAKSFHDGPDLLRKLHRDYVYFRFYGDAQRELKFVEGSIKTYSDGNAAVFEHRSHNWKKKPAEHTGFLFRSQSHLYMLGFGDGLMRLAIGNMPAGKNPENVISGMVLSRRSFPPNDPFSARFIMIATENKELLNELQDKTRSDMTKPEHWSSNPSKRISKFFELVGDQSNFYLIFGVTPEPEPEAEHEPE